MYAGRRYLMEAATKGDMDLLDYALTQPYMFTDLNDALLRTSTFGHCRCARKLLSCGADVNAVDADGDTPLMLAAANDHYSVSKLLLAVGAKIDHTSDRGRTALHAAVWNDRRDIIRLLLNSGADVRVQEQYGETVVMLCSKRGFADILRVLLRNGCDSNIKSDEEDTALHYASRYNHSDCVDLLLRHDLSGIDAKNMWGYTSLMLAILYASDQIVLLLLDAGASSLERDHSERTPLYHAVTKDRNSNIVSRLMLNDNINLPDRYTVTPIMAAVLANLNNQAKLLLEEGADVRRKCRACLGGEFEYWSVAQAAIYKKNLFMLEMLLNSGADLQSVYVFLKNVTNTNRLSNDDEMVNYVCEIFSTPFSLKAISRISIRRQLGFNIS